VRDGAAPEPVAAADVDSSGAREIEFAVGYPGETRERVPLLIRFPRAELITVEEGLAEVDRFLAT
jgi:hypothetical protein